MTPQGNPILAMIVLGTTFMGVHTSLAQTIDASKVAKVKSAYLLNFAKFTTWPDNAFAHTDSPLVICVWGRSDIAKTIDRVIEGHTVRGRTVVISHIKAPTDKSDSETAARPHHTGRKLREQTLVQLRNCHLLYIAETDANRLHDLLKAIENLAILTVSDVPQCVEQGVMLGLVLSNGRITFEANATSIRQARVKVSSKLLKLAKLVPTSEEVP